ncbi:MAG: hypothetical protein JXM70_08685 [Pirellulales bacterium]|nr:hypothetical protein [Pirellulales bacterium]
MMSEEPGWSGDVMGQFYMEHPEYRIGPNPKSWYERAQNWAIPEVRDYKFALMKEIIDNYDIDGFELDFLRHCSLFQLERTTPEQRKEIMTRFVAKVRKALDDSSKPGEHKWLCVRIPSYLDTHDALGIDVRQLVSAGVDMVNLSGFFFMEPQNDLGKIVKLIPDTPVYIEMNHIIQSGKNVAKHRHGSFTFRRATENQFYTTAHLAYAQGATGVSMFNFAYYRDNGVPGRGPFHEPPFHIFKHLGDKAWIAQQDQHYILTKAGNTPPSKTRQLPKEFTKGVTQSIKMFMAEPTGGWKQNGKLRIESDKLLGDSKWAVTFNRVSLKETSDRSEPYETPYQNLLGEEGQYRAFVVPFDIVKNGNNDIQVTMIDGKLKYKIIFMDIAIKYG